MNTLKAPFLLTCLTLLTVAIGSAIGGAIGGQSGTIMTFVIAGGMSFIFYRYFDKIVLKMYTAPKVAESENPPFYDNRGYYK